MPDRNRKLMKNMEWHAYSTHLSNTGVGMLVGMLFLNLWIEFLKLSWSEDR